MSLRNEVFQPIPFDASSDANEPLIAAGDAEEEDHRLEEKALSRFKFSSLLLGLLVGFFVYSSTLGVKFLFNTIWGEDAVVKSETDNFTVSLLCGFFFLVIVFVILGFLRNLVAITYSAIGGRSKEQHEEKVWYMICGFVVGALLGIVWPITGLMGTRAQTMYSLVALRMVAFFWRKIMIMYFTTNFKPSSSRGSAVEQTTV